MAARSLGVFARHVDEMFRHMWADPKQMDDPAVIAAAFAEWGFDGEKILALAQTREVKDELLANTTRSVERGAFGSQTFLSARTSCATPRSGSSR